MNLKRAPGLRFIILKTSSSLCEQRSLLSWSIARRGVCAHITCRKLVLKSASCNLKRKQEVTAKQKLCIENKGELKNPVVYIVFSRRRKESSVGETRLCGVALGAWVFLLRSALRIS